MASGLDALTSTHNCKILLATRLIGGLPLVFFGAMHLIGAMPMKPLIEAAGLPMPDAMAILAPLAQLIAGLLLVAGAFARVGAIIAIGTMLGAVVTQIKIPNDAWPMPTPEDAAAVGPEPVFMLAIAGLIIIASVVVIWKGAGAMSLDIKGSAQPETAPA